jgi:hypothetical protein
MQTSYLGLTCKEKFSQLIVNVNMLNQNHGALLKERVSFLKTGDLAKF